jgi:hypothetical protein
LLFSGNFNGDAYDDLILFARTQGKVYVALSTGSSFSSPEIWHNWFAVSTYERPRVGDVNGDGMDDIITFATDSPTAQGDVYVSISDGSRFVDQYGNPDNSDKWHDWFSVEPTQIIRIGDLNGDGKDDFFTFMPPPNGQVYTVISQGTSMTANVLWHEEVCSSDTDLPFVGDANGDGKADIIYFAQGDGKAKVSPAKGTIPTAFTNLVNAGGGVEGGPITETMSVVVFDARNWTPINGATVSIGTDGTNSTITDNNGLASFSGLSGAQTVTVLAEGFQTIVTLGGVDAIRIAIPLHKTPDSATVTRLTGQTDASTMMVKTNFGANGPTLFSNPFSGDLTGTYTTSSGTGIIPGFSFAVSAFSPVTLRPLNGVSTPSTYPPPDILVFTDQAAMSLGESRILNLDFSTTSEADLTRFTINNTPVRYGPTIGPLVMEGSALAIYAKLPNGITSFTPRPVFQNAWPYHASPGPLLVGESEWLEGAFDAQGAFREITGANGYEIATIGLDAGGHVWYSSLHYTSPPVSPVGPFITISPADADDLTYGLPEYNATGVGTTATLGWERVDPANFYKVTLFWSSSASMGGHWTIYLPAGSSGFTIPTLPTGVASAGLQIGELVNWDVQPMIINGLNFNNMTGTSIRDNILSLCAGGDSYFTP